MTVHSLALRVRVTLQLTVYCPSVHLGTKLLEDHDQRLFISATEPLQSYSLCNVLSDEKMGLSLRNMLGLSTSVCIANIACYWKFFLLHYIQVLFSSGFGT
jgi:hypothetical protein